MLYRISVTERGLTGIANIFRSRLSRLDDLLGAGTVPLTWVTFTSNGAKIKNLCELAHIIISVSKRNNGHGAVGSSVIADRHSAPVLPQ